MLRRAVHDEIEARELLRRVPGATEVVAGREGCKLIGAVVSRDFAGMEEIERQSFVWG